VQRAILLILIALISLPVYAQKGDPPSDVQPIIDAERAFEAVAGAQGIKAAFLEYLATDSTIFRPGPVNGQQFWKASDDPASLLLSRNITFSDISSNGILGYTTGNWRLYQRGKSESYAKFGQYVTIWEKKPDGRYEATIDINITHDKLPYWETDRFVRRKESKELNKRGWSPADASMQFTRLSMNPGGGLGAAYEQFAAEDVRLLHDGDPPILGKKHVTEATKTYLSMRFPEKIALYQAADMAYTWNPCQFANNNEGIEQGNCLHIWKLRDKKWEIVLGVFARTPNDTPPVLKSKDRNTAAH
jgi:ketosteroid isomerase-like protein